MSEESKQDPWSGIRISEIRSGASGDRVIIAHSRRKKPSLQKKEQSCIFCPENRQSLAESYFQGTLHGEMEKRGLYIIDNKFPVVSYPELSRDLILPGGGPTFDRIPATGRHLLMIETPNHNLNPFSDSAETRDYYGNLIWGYRKMMQSLRDDGYEWGGLGKNRNGVNNDGSVALAGASQSHPHSQAIATGILPTWLEDYLSLRNRFTANE